ncbi:probable ATP-dependent RNA helicase Dbp73D [Neodiprion lecontei]|uniref:ATP-dependent RNA helicase n=1 Tax=Neodiprion lecontei TaxID=441921 RepID=A0A6J0BUB1_NEOLC|nr:probable ATP-dependent RNA helicase Dbp73D [Neodiprion lecontei]
MSLFVVNRYQGNDDNAPESTTTEDHYTTLLKKIEERKKRKSATQENEVNKDGVDSSEVSVEKKKRKKQKPSTTQENGAKRKDTTTPEQITTSLQFSATEVNDPVASEQRESLTETTSSTQKATAKKPAYLILGSDSHKKKPVIKRVLPEWLSQPELISADVNSGPSLSDFKSILDSDIIDILKKSGATKLFPVQANIIPWLLECDRHRKMGWWPRDVCISAPTGSGKTLAYVLPIIQLLKHRFVRKVRCLVVLPVQELAAQVYKVVKTYSEHTNLRVTLLSSAATFQQEQKKLVKQDGSGKYISKVDFIVTTPGRLIDHIERTEGFSLSSLRYLVIDEADKATDWLQHLPAPHCGSATLNISNIESKNRPTQKLLFSATLSQDPEKLSRLGLFQPKLFTSVLPEDKDIDLNLDKATGDFVGRYTSPDELVEKAVECETLNKPLALFQLLTGSDEVQRALVFTNSGNTAHRLALLINLLGKKRGLTVAEISARLDHKKRESVLSQFAQGDIQVLISSDALARGMDISGVNLVVSYDLPKHIKGYIHRSGRTGRAGTPGTAVSILTPAQVAAFSKMLTSARKSVPVIEKVDLDSFSESPDYEEHIVKLREMLEEEQVNELNHVKSVKRRHKRIHK